MRSDWWSEAIRVGGMLACLGAGLSAGPPAQAHPMGNFSICHYTRLEAFRDRVYLRYLLDMAEIPTVSEKEALDANRDGFIAGEEKRAYLDRKTPQLLSGLTLIVDGRPIRLTRTAAAVRLLPGAGGLDILKIAVDIEASLPEAGASYTVVYKDGNYAMRTGWKEIVAIGRDGVTLQGSTVPAVDRSRELSLYPQGVIPPQDTGARFRVVLSPRLRGDYRGAGHLAAGWAARQEPDSPAAQRPSGSPATPRDAFTRLIARRELPFGVQLVGVLIAFIFGAFHALSPGHGKAMVAAYLVGARGTARHAVFLGLVVTVTHTLGVFALGLVTLFASQYVVPERLYGILSLISGALVCGVGGWLFYSRLRGLPEGHHHPHHADPDHPHDHMHVHSHHGHTHDHVHNDGPPHHHHLPEGPVTPKALLALGISGGLVPCPSALVVLLSAIALHRIAYGMLLISAFSLGLAGVLVVIGLMVVWARGWFERLPTGGRLLRRLPVASAAVITGIGIVLVVRALEQGLR